MKATLPLALLGLGLSFALFGLPATQASDTGMLELAQTTAEQAVEDREDDHDGHSAEHGDQFAPVFETFAIILLCAVVGRFGARKLKQSAVLGELVIGIVVGAVLYQLGAPGVIIIRHNDVVRDVTQKVLAENEGWKDAVEAVVAQSDLSDNATKKIEAVVLSDEFPKYFILAKSVLLFSSLGVALLLFMVGLECSIEEMQEVGGSAFGVALLGVVVPFALGYGTAALILPQGTDANIPIFVGATLCATSIGITARVFKDMNKLAMSEAKIVLGAAVIDDVLGLIVLAIVSGIVTSGSVHLSTIGLIFLKASIFLGAVILLGTRLLKGTIAFFAKLDQSNIKLLYPFALLMLLAWLADAIGLATIVGAFAAGLIIKEEYFVLDKASEHGKASVESILAPIEGIFAPVFFVLMGVQVDVGTFLDPRVLAFGLALTVVAMIGKLAAPLLAKKGNDKLIIGIGLVPRGEVGLIFASIGKSLGVLTGDLFSVIIIVVLLTTLATPPLLKWAIARKERAQDA